MKHLKLFETQEEYRQHLAEGGGLTDLPKVALCQDNSTMKYNPKKARKAWFTKGVDTDNYSDTYGDTLPLLFSTTGIQSVKINGKILEDFIPPYDEIVNYTFEDIINNNTWDGDIFSGITDENGNTTYQMNTPTTILPALNADDTITFSDDFDIKEYCATVWLTDGIIQETLEVIFFNSDRFSSNFVIDNNVLSWNTNGEIFGIISMYEELGLPVRLMVIPYKYSNPYESNYTFKHTYVQGTTQIMPTEEMFTNAPIWEYYEYEGQTTPQKLPIIEMELEFNSPSIPEIYFYGGLDKYREGSVLAISDGFFNGLNVVPNKWTLPLFERFEINGNIATSIPYTHFEIPESVTKIGWQAFVYATFTSVTIPDSVTEIGMGAFNYCDNLKELIIPDSVTKLDDLIGYYEGICRFCNSLETVIIGDGVTTIPDYFASDCRNLKNVHLGHNITSIGNSAFDNCTSLPIIDNFRYADTCLVEAIDKTLTTYAIKEGTRFIHSMAFYKCTSLTNIEILDSVKSIGQRAFYNCSNLTSVTLGNGLTSIGDGAFYYCTRLTNIEIPDSVTSIGTNAFRECRNLTSIIIPDSVTSLGERAFSNCSGLTSVTLGSGLTSIGWYVFSGCTNLTSIEVPNNVTSIDSNAFYQCTNLASITCKATNAPTLGNTVFGSISSTGTLYYPKGSDYSTWIEALPDDWTTQEMEF